MLSCATATFVGMTSIVGDKEIPAFTGIVIRNR